jgi:hypothetical protein
MRRPLLALFAFCLAAAPLSAQGACDLSKVPGAVWWGTDATMTFDRLAAYAAPVIWFSPDEPNLYERSGAAINIPEQMLLPGVDTTPLDHPVMYYQVEGVFSRSSDGQAFTWDSASRGTSVLDLAKAQAVEVSYLAYYRSEIGVGAHPHDIEPAEMRMLILKSEGDVVRKYAGPGCAAGRHVIAVTRSTGKAHGLIWFWNVLQTDEATQFPMTFLIEEGKHAFATDANGDGYFTKGFDVNVRVNDAWGVRDNMRTGIVFTGGYESFMTKVRKPEHQVLPPLPEDSPLRRALARRTRGQTLATYELRPFPAREAAGDDHGIGHLMDGKTITEPRSGSLASPQQVLRYYHSRTALKSLSINARYDGDMGFSFVFPFFIVKHLMEPMTGGYLVQRMYLKDEGLRDFGWQLMYTPSASRWLDSYFAVGAEQDDEQLPGQAESHDWEPTFETGIKMRVAVEHSPLPFLAKLTPYWGIRAGIINRGAFQVQNIRYILELGAGSF